VRVVARLKAKQGAMRRQRQDVGEVVTGRILLVRSSEIYIYICDFVSVGLALLVWYIILHGSPNMIAKALLFFLVFSKRHKKIIWRN
jgi:hypothetical protein